MILGLAEFLDTIPKAQSMKEMMDNLDFIVVKIYSLKDIVLKNQRIVQKLGENICKLYM